MDTIKPMQNMGKKVLIVRVCVILITSKFDRNSICKKTQIIDDAKMDLNLERFKI